MPVIVSPLSTRTLGDLKTRIADELARSDLTNQIALAVTDAIEEACKNRFWFMEARSISLPLLAGTSIYIPATALIEIDRVRLFVGGQQRTLRQMNDDEMSRLNDGTAPRGEPYAYSLYGGQVAFYPTPTQSYSVLIDGTTKGATLANDGDSNIWTDPAFGERYVRALAKRDLYGHVIRDADKALAQDQFAQRYRSDLLEQSYFRSATGEMAACD